MDNIIESYTEKGLCVKITTMEDPQNPRDWDNLGTMVCSHNRYELGDVEFDHSLYNSWSEVLRGECGTIKDIIHLPLYLYDHSGITMNTTGFADPWDSGQVGWIYVTRSKVREWYGVKRVSPKLEEEIRQCLINEVRLYDNYLTGEVYEFTVSNEAGELIDSVGGYFGYDFNENGLYAEARNCINNGGVETDSAI